jgi:hypothetical protein
MLRYRHGFLILIVLYLLACRAVFPTIPAQMPTETNTSLPSPTVSIAIPTVIYATPSHLPGTPATSTPAVTLLPTNEPSLTSQDTPYQVRFHPEGPLYVGDQVSLEVIARTEDTGEAEKRQVQVKMPDGGTLGPVDISRYGLGGRRQATFLWAWNTSQLLPGNYQLEISILPDGPIWTETVSLLPNQQMSFPEPEARWSMVKTECCLINFITLTEAQRDLPRLMMLVDEQARMASQRMNTRIDEPITINFLPRLLGHGGFADQEISISYLDRNYAGGNLETVLHHELIHWLDNRLGGDYRPSILVEGLAVYLSGGHFKPEPLLSRAAATLDPEDGCLPADKLFEDQADPVCGLGWFIPLKELTDRFYTSQHEIGYLEAAALVEYMVEKWGWDKFIAFYRDIRPPTEQGIPGEHSQSAALEAALQAHFGVGLEGLEQEFIVRLMEQKITPGLVEDVRLSVAFYDTVRRYQEIYDPSAYFLTAWLVNGKEMRQKGITADYLRHPVSASNIALEVMLAEADLALRAGKFARVELVLEAVNQVLDYPSPGDTAAFARHPLANDTFGVVNTLEKAGFRAQRVRIDQDTARAWATRPGPELVELSLTRSRDGWRIDGEVAISASRAGRE